MSIRRAAIEAKKSAHTQHKMGAVVVKGGNILATGYNSMQPSKVLGTNTRHAEAAAILKLLKENKLHELSGSSIWVTRFTRGGRVGMAYPCQECYNLIRSVGIKSVHYTTDGGTESHRVR